MGSCHRVQLGARGHNETHTPEFNAENAWRTLQSNSAADCNRTSWLRDKRLTWHGATIRFLFRLRGDREEALVV